MKKLILAFIAPSLAFSQLAIPNPPSRQGEVVGWQNSSDRGFPFQPLNRPGVNPFTFHHNWVRVPEGLGHVNRLRSRLHHYQNPNLSEQNKEFLENARVLMRVTEEQNTKEEKPNPKEVQP